MGLEDSASRQPLLGDARPQDGQAAPDGSSSYVCPPEQHVHRNRDASTLPDGPPPPIRTQGAGGPYPELPPQPGYHQRGGDTPRIQQVIVVHSTSFPPRIYCPHCGRQGPTIAYKVSGFCTWFTASLCCFIGCCLLFPFVFCCDPLKDTVHYCGHCRRYIGRTPA